jgi:hypothetical protein
MAKCGGGRPRALRCPGPFTRSQYHRHLCRVQSRPPGEPGAAGCRPERRPRAAPRPPRGPPPRGSAPVRSLWPPPGGSSSGTAISEPGLPTSRRRPGGARQFLYVFRIPAGRVRRGDAGDGGDGGAVPGGRRGAARRAAHGGARGAGPRQPAVSGGLPGGGPAARAGRLAGQAGQQRHRPAGGAGTRADRRAARHAGRARLAAGRDDRRDLPLRAGHLPRRRHRPDPADDHRRADPRPAQGARPQPESAIPRGAW